MSRATAEVQVVVPVLNEQRRLVECIPRLHEVLSAIPDLSYEIVIANNGSCDDTQSVAERLARQYRCLRVVQLPKRGRGGALRTVWLGSDAKILTYMDVDLSTDLAAFPALLRAIGSGHFDVAIGSRLAAGAYTQRCWKREVTSRFYARLVRLLFGTGLRDFQCGFKAVSHTAACKLLPLIQDTGWFFDTELLLLAERFGYRILEAPVRWRENRDSRVQVWQTAMTDLAGLMRLRKTIGVAGKSKEACPPASRLRKSSQP